jgi:hypothetical protein
MASYSGVWLGRFRSINHNARDCALVRICPRCTHSSRISLSRVYHRSSPTIGLRIYANTVGSPKTMRTRASSWVQPPDNGIGTPLRPTIPSFQLLSLPPPPPLHTHTPTQPNPTHKLQNPKTHKHKGRWPPDDATCSTTVRRSPCCAPPSHGVRDPGRARQLSLRASRHHTRPARLIAAIGSSLRGQPREYAEQLTIEKDGIAPGRARRHPCSPSRCCSSDAKYLFWPGWSRYPGGYLRNGIWR